VFQNKMWVIAGRGISGELKDVWSSSDGVTWTQDTSGADFRERILHTSVVFDSKMWVFQGATGGVPKNDGWNSIDGKNWVQTTTSSAVTARYGHSTVLFKNRIWTIGGTSGLNELWYSWNGIDWTLAIENGGFGGRLYSTASVYDDKIWIIGNQLTGEIWYLD